AVVRGFDATLASERENEQVLRSVRVRHAESDGKHELGALVRDLQRPERLIAERRLLLQVHFGDEEFHALFEVAREYARSACRDSIPVFLQPPLETLALSRREDQDVVFAYRVAGFDRDGLAGQAHQSGA